MAELDAVFILMAGMVALVALCLGLLVGRMLDPMYRIKQLRKFLKRNYIIMYFVSKDGKTLLPRMVNADEDVVLNKGGLWTVEKGKIFRKLPPQPGSTVPIKEGGFNFNQADNPEIVRYEEGVPVIFVDNEHIKPLQFNNEDAKVTPSGVGAAINAWVTNAIAKGLAGVQKNMQILLYIILFLMVIVAYFSYDTNGKVGDCKTAAVAQTQSKIPVGGSVQNGTLVINQPGVTGGGGGK